MKNDIVNIGKIANEILQQNSFNNLINTTDEYQDCFDDIVKVLKRIF